MVKTDVNIGMNVHTHAHAGRESYLRGYKSTNGVKTHRT